MMCFKYIINQLKRTKLWLTRILPTESFKGLPITLIAAAILSCSFFGFAGVVDNIVG